MKPLYIIDGTAYIYRAFYAVRSLSTSDGRPTNAIFGVAQMMMKVLRDFSPERAAIVFDSKEKNFRHAMFPEYKANRMAPPEGLIEQIPAVRELVSAFNIAVLEVPGVEADDVIGTLAVREAAAGGSCVIITGDKDLMQLVSDRITVYDSMKEKRYDTEGVREKFGVGPERVIDILSLAGDSSDNIPGVKGVGEVTAEQLVSEFGSLEDIYQSLDKLKSQKLREKLLNSRESAFLSKKLATIVTDVPLDLTDDALLTRPPDAARLRELFAKYQFKALVGQLSSEPSAPQAPVAATPASTSSAAPSPAEAKLESLGKRDYRVVLDEAALMEAAAAIKGAKEISLDTETTSSEPMRAHLVGVSVGVGDGIAYYIPIGHRSLDAPRQLKWEAVRPVLAQALEGVSVCAQNSKYDLVVLRRHGIDVDFRDDTLLASYLLDPEGNHSLKALSRQHLGHEMLTFEEVVPKGRREGGFAEVPVETAARYSCEDADVTMRLLPLLSHKLMISGLTPLYREVEMPLVSILAGMEMTGVRVERKMLETLSTEMVAGLARASAEIYALAGTEFNISSPKQLAEVLFGKLGLRVVKRTKTGPSTDSEVLDELSEDHEIAAKVLEYRSLEKLRGTYVDALPLMINRETSRIHCSFNQAGTATGRLSSSQPNLQNIPIRTPLGKMIRQAFAANEGFVLLSADYSQIELRVLAHFSGDPTMIAAFESGEDIHARTASEIFGVAREMVTPEMRRAAKTINFGIVYGMGAFRLARALDIKRTEAQSYIDGYFARIPGVKRFMEDTVEKARGDGFVTTLFGRKRPVQGLTSHNAQIRTSAERVAINTPIQGTAADIMKIAMIRVKPLLGERARLLLQVHDELLFEVRAEYAEELKAEVCNAMEKSAKLAVPLKVDAGTGMNWAEAH